jgi:hypothetical protein
MQRNLNNDLREIQGEIEIELDQMSMVFFNIQFGLFLCFVILTVDYKKNELSYL